MNAILEKYTIEKQMNSHVSLPIDTIKKFTKEFGRDYKYYLREESLDELFNKNKDGMSFISKDNKDYKITLKSK